MFDGSLRAYDRIAAVEPASTAPRRWRCRSLFVAGAGYLFHGRAEGVPAERRSGPLSDEHRSDSGHRLRGNGPLSAGSGGDPRSRIRTSRDSAAASGFGGGGGGGGAAGNQGRFGVDLKPRAERTRSVDQIMAGLRPKLAQVPGVRVFMVNPPPINLGGGGGGRATYQFTLQDTDTAELYRVGAALRRRDAEDSRASRTSTAISGSTILRCRSASNRDRIAALGLDGQPGRNGALQCVRHPPGLADLRGEQSVPGHSAGRIRSSSRIRPRCRCSTCARRPANSFRSTLWRA